MQEIKKKRGKDMIQKRIFIPTNGADSWQPLLAEPGKQWKKGYSARTLANCWEGCLEETCEKIKTSDFPKSIEVTFQNSKIDLFKNVKLLFAFPEYKVKLPGGGRESQNDIYVIAKNTKEVQVLK